MEELLNSQQVADLLGMSKVWVYKQAESGLLPFYRVGEGIRFDPEEIDAYLDSRKGIKRIYGKSRNPKGRRKKVIRQEELKDGNHLVNE
jgi:excisionase family DNA binding protein